MVSDLYVYRMNKCIGTFECKSVVLQFNYTFYDFNDYFINELLFYGLSLYTMNKITMKNGEFQ